MNQKIDNFASKLREPAQKHDQIFFKNFLLLDLLTQFYSSCHLRMTGKTSPYPQPQIG